MVGVAVFDRCSQLSLYVESVALCAFPIPARQPPESVAGTRLLAELLEKVPLGSMLRAQRSCSPSSLPPCDHRNIL